MVSVKIVMKTNKIAGRGRGMNPNSLRIHRKGNKIAKAARIPNIAPEAPIVGMVDELFRYAWNSPAMIPHIRYSAKNFRLPSSRSTASPLSNKNNMLSPR